MLLVAVGLFYTNEANRAQQELAQRGQITDRLAKAVEQLGQPGPDTLSTRLGGVYALQRLMRESPGDEPAIIDILSAFVRTQTAHTLSPQPSDLPSPDPLVIALGDEPPSPPDVQAALTVLAYRPDPNNPAHRRIILTGAHISIPGVNLSDGHLDEVDLRGANLRGTGLAIADLNSADLRGAYLGYAHLGGADLDGADLTDANLVGAVLGAASLSNANLAGADLTGANLRGAFLFRADLRGANLSGANLSNTNLEGADLTGAITDAATVLPGGVTVPPAPTPSASPSPRPA